MSVKKLKAIKEKLKNDKKLFILFLFASLAVLFLFISFPEEKDNDENEKEETSGLDRYQSYAEKTEERLKTLVESIDGAGRAAVMITVESGTETVYASNKRYGGEISDDGERKGEQNEGENEYVIVRGDDSEEGLPLKTVLPEIRGVAVVCEGADSPEVRKNVAEAVTAVLGISFSKISVTKMRSE